jgi:hypothetical protein
VGVGRIPRTHLLGGGGEQAAAVENTGVFGEKAEDQAGHEVVHVAPPLLAAPVGVFAEKFEVEAVQATGGADVKGVFPDLLDGGDAGERQEEAEVIGKRRVIADDGFAIVGKALGLQRDAIGGEDELGLLLGGGRAIPQGGKGGRDLACRADLEVNIVALEDAAGEIGLVRVTTPQALEGGFLISEGFEEGVGKCLCLERDFREP